MTELISLKFLLMWRSLDIYSIFNYTRLHSVSGVKYTGCPKILVWIFTQATKNQITANPFLIKIHAHTYILNTNTFLSDLRKLMY